MMDGCRDESLQKKTAPGISRRARARPALPMPARFRSGATRMETSNAGRDPRSGRRSSRNNPTARPSHSMMLSRISGSFSVAFIQAACVAASGTSGFRAKRRTPGDRCHSRIRFSSSAVAGRRRTDAPLADRSGTKAIATRRPPRPSHSNLPAAAIWASLSGCATRPLIQADAPVTSSRSIISAARAAEIPAAAARWLSAITAITDGTPQQHLSSALTPQAPTASKLSASTWIIFVESICKVASVRQDLRRAPTSSRCGAAAPRNTFTGPATPAPASASRARPVKFRGSVPPNERNMAVRLFGPTGRLRSRNAPYAGSRSA